MKHTKSSRRFAILLAVGMPLFSAVSAAQNPTFSVKTLPDIAGGTGTNVNGISAGQAVGYVCSVNPECPTRQTAIWSGLIPTPLGSVVGETSTRGNSINTAGQVAGIAYNGSNLSRITDVKAVVWTNGIVPLSSTAALSQTSRRAIGSIWLLAVLIMAVSVAASNARAQTYSVVHSFCSQPSCAVGATTGPIVVLLPNGTLESNVAYTVN